MRAVVWLGACALLGTGAVAFAQHSPGGNQAGSSPSPSASSALPPVAPIPPLGVSNSPVRRAPGNSRGGRWLGGFPYASSDDGDVYPTEPEPAEIQQPPAYVIQQQAQREKVRPEIHEYGPPDQPEPAGEPSYFSIAFKDGRVDSAMAVAVQGGKLMYVDSEGRQVRVSFDAIDREATRRLNRAKGLVLQLPAPTP